MVNDNGNGHEDPGDVVQKEALKSLFHDVRNIQDSGGLFPSSGKSQYQSLLHRVISAILSNDDYRNERKIARWMSLDEPDDAVAALEECFELGMDPTPIIDQIIARSSGPQHELLFKALETLNYSTFTINQELRQKNRNGHKQTPSIS